MLVLFVVVSCPATGLAQFLRIGPFEFNANTGLELIYTTNVEGERPSEAERAREDFYLVPSIALQSSTIVGPRMNVGVNMGYSREIHMVRDDLDVDLGEIRGTATYDLEPFNLQAGAYWTRDTEMVEDDVYVPSSLSDVKRKVGTSSGYDIALNGTTRYLFGGVTYGYVEERFDDEEFQEQEKDETTIGFVFGVLLSTYATIQYETEKTETVFINVPGSATEDRTETVSITADQLFGLLERPLVTYSIGIQREYDDGETDGWELVHTISISDEWQLNPALHLRAFASYTIEQNPDEDDVALQYGVTLTHDISDRATHYVSASQQPVETFGSTEETEQTEFSYGLNIKDFLVATVDFYGTVGYTISTPTEGEQEQVLSYAVGLNNSAVISPKLTRNISYAYTREDSNQEREILEEHRLILSFRYQF